MNLSFEIEQQLSLYLHNYIYMYIAYRKMTIDSKKWITLEFWISWKSRIDECHIIKLNRPEVDEEWIRKRIKNDMLREYEEWLFKEEIQKEMEWRVQESIKEQEDRISSLPRPVIFTWTTEETKFIWWWIIMKLKICDETAKYFLENYVKVEDMKCWLEFFPFCMDKELQSNQILEIRDEFLNENDDSMEIKMCFDPFEILAKRK